MEGEILKGYETSIHTLYCSFCGKSQHEVKKLIAGPTVFICDECVELCSDLIKQGSSVPLPANEAVAEPCQHDALSFASGDYYVSCANCNIRWAVVSPNQPEYGVGKLGQAIGTTPRLANRGFISYNDTRNVRVVPYR